MLLLLYVIQYITTYYFTFFFLQKSQAWLDFCFFAVPEVLLVVDLEAFLIDSLISGLLTEEEEEEEAEDDPP